MTSGTLMPTIGVMSTKMSVVITDDLDGSEGADTVAFGFDGVSYEIDLGKANRARLEQSLAPFLAAGRRTAGRSGRRSGSRRAAHSADLAAVRSWAREAGLNISERGRISAAVMKQYEATH